MTPGIYYFYEYQADKKIRNVGFLKLTQTFQSCHLQISIRQIPAASQEKLPLSMFFFEKDINPFYHSSEDVIGHLNMAYCAEIVRAATATAAIARTKDLKTWERLPDLKTKSQQRNVVLHPEFVDGKYALYTRPQDGFIDTGSGGGIGWGLVDDITNAEVKDEKIINHRYYHTIKELKNGEGPHPIKTEKGWLVLYHGVEQDRKSVV